ncbi:PilZ domain-containing protein [Actinoplanes sp. NPDC026670]|uniref:PilZ domain-containing protein n=1 Tax=Actinoplanes sp. NPDC026670 TaxID=3154700 RepID=UPI0033DA78C7
MVEFPPVGTPVFLAADAEATYRSRLEEVDGTQITVSAPLETTDRITLQPGQRLELFWAQPRSRAVLPCQLVSTGDDASSRWVLKAVGAPATSNRRQFVRGGGGGALHLLADEQGPLGARLLDISEGGLRCWTEHAVQAAVNDRIQAAVSLHGGNVEIDGVVHAVRDAWDMPGYNVVMRFEAEEALAKSIRQHIFASEIAERRRGQD